MDIIIEIENLKKSFGDNAVLNDIDLNVERGENLVVLGKSGGGKSVLIKCIIGLIEPDEGVLKVFGESIEGIKPDKLNELRRKIGFLFQGAALYDSMSVRENLEFPLRRQIKKMTPEELNERVAEALKNVGLEGSEDIMPVELSGGMRKRIGLARTLILKPELILYDEPTTGLDPVTSREISNLIIDVQKKYNTSSIIITHDLQCAKIAGDRIVILKEGEFVAEGKYKDLEKSKDPFVKAFFE